MSPPGSISLLLSRLKAGDTAAVGPLWDRYCDQLARLARQKLQKRYRRVEDEEDIATRAFYSLCAGAQKGRFPAVTSRDSLWGLLVFITAQKAADWVAHERRKKRGGGKVRGHDALSRGSFDELLDNSPGPVTLNAWVEEYEQLLKRLGDATLRKIAELSVQGYKVDEIAEQLGLARRTIHRKLDRIRAILLSEVRL